MPPPALTPPARPAAPAASPTGAPLIQPKAVPALLAIGCAAAAAAFYLPDGSTADRIAEAVVSVLSFLGLASPGLRR